MDFRIINRKGSRTNPSMRELSMKNNIPLKTIQRNTEVLRRMLNI